VLFILCYVFVHCAVYCSLLCICTLCRLLFFVMYLYIVLFIVLCYVFVHCAVYCSLLCICRLYCFCCWSRGCWPSTLIKTHPYHHHHHHCHCHYLCYISGTFKFISSVLSEIGIAYERFPGRLRCVRMGGLNQDGDLTRIQLSVPTSALRFRKHKRPTVNVVQVPKYEALVLINNWKARELTQMVPRSNHPPSRLQTPSN